jgi:hypothetical protein
MGEHTQGTGPDDGDIGQLLSASADRTPVIRPERRAEMLSALLAENARLAQTRSRSTQETQVSEKQTPAFPPAITGLGRRFQERIRAARLALPDVAGALDTLANLTRGYAFSRVTAGLASAAIVALFGVLYYGFGGRQSTVIATVEGPHRLTESRIGIGGLRWQVRDLLVNTGKRSVHAGDQVAATGQITITFASQKTAVLTQGSSVALLSDKRMRLLNGRLAGEFMASNTPGGASAFTVEASQATFEVGNTVFDVAVDNTGRVTQSTHQGTVIAKSQTEQAAIGVGEQTIINETSPALDVIVQAPVVVTENTATGVISFTAQTVHSGSLVIIDKQTGAELAIFKADENGVVTGELADMGAPSTLTFQAKTDDNRISVMTAAADPAASRIDPINPAILRSTATIAPNPAVTVDAPKLRLPAISPVQASSRSGALVAFDATLIENGREFSAICDRPSPSVFQIGISIVTCSGSGDNGRAVSGTFKVTVEDREKPGLSLPGPIRAEATSGEGATVAFEATANDAITGPLTPLCSTKTGAVFPLGSTTVSCSATDEYGNKSTGSFDVIVVDGTKPALQLPGNIVTGARNGSGAVVDFSVSAQDRVDAKPSVTCSTTSGATFPLGETRVTCTATDNAGNRDSGSFVVSVIDGDKPSLIVPADMTLEAISKDGAAVSFETSAEDSVDRALTVSCSPASGSVFKMGSTRVSCSTADRAGNSSSAGFTVLVQDKTKPRLSLPKLDVIAAATASGAVVSFSPNAEDNLDGKLAVKCSPLSGSTFALGTTTVSCSASDSSGNSAQDSFSVRVADLTRPVLSIPESLADVEATSASGAAVSFQVTASDAVDGALGASCTHTSGSTFALGTTTVSCTASDKAGNSVNGRFSIKVADTVAPAINVPDRVNVAAASSSTAVSWSASARDAVDGSVAVVCTPVSGSNFAVGTTTVTCSAKDKAGNQRRDSFKVFVVDRTAPDLSVPGDLSMEASSASGATVAYSTVARDAVDGEVQVSCSAASGSTFALGTTQVTCSAADKSGQRASKTFNVSVVDTTGPSIDRLAAITRDTLSPDGATVAFEVKARDLVNGPVAASCSPASGSLFSVGTTRVSCRASDTRGNSSTSEFSVVVNYIPPTATPEPPTVTPAPPTVTPEPPTVTPEPPTVTPEPPTVTPEPPTLTPEPPTVTPEPPTVTPEPPTVTPEPPTLTPEPSPAPVLNSTGTPAPGGGEPGGNAGPTPEAWLLGDRAQV